MPAAWVWAGLRPSLYSLAVFAAAGVLGGLTLGAPRAVRQALVGDPVFGLGLVFLIYLGLQAANAGRTAYYDVGLQRWTYSPPPWPGWPSAFSQFLEP